MGSKRIILPRSISNRCLRFGCEVVISYRVGNNDNSLSVSSHDAENDPLLQAQGKAGECAVCLWRGGSIEQLNWQNRPDGGFDLMIDKYRVDVKTIDINKRFLIWPINKRHLFHVKQFDVMILVKAALPFEFHICGYVSKQRFAERHRVADAAHPLSPGTWYMENSQLGDIEDFSPPAPITAEAAIAAGRQFEFISGRHP